MDTALISQYALVAIATALIAGILLGYTLRAARARRERSSLEGELDKARQQLAAANLHGNGPAPPAPLRWTGTEVAAVIGAVGALLGTLGTLYLSFQGGLKTQLEATKSELARLRQDVAGTFVYDVAAWRALKPTAPSTKPGKRFTVDGLNPSLDCARVPVRYMGSGPGIARCGPGTTSLRLDGATRLFLVPEPDAGPAREATP